MTTTLKLKGGTTAQNAAYTGSAREVTVDTQQNILVVHDGVTAGGFPMLPGVGDVTLTGTQTLTNKTLSGVILNDGYTEEVFVLTGTTPSLTAANGSIQTWNLTANSTPTDGLTTGQSIILGVDDGTAYSVTWPSVVWSKVGGGGAAPTLATTGRTWVVLWKVGATLYGSHLGDA